MFSLFQRKQAHVASAPTPSPPAGLMPPQTAAMLLGTPRRQKLLEHIWQRTALSREQFAQLYRRPIERYAALVQHLPASESHHHAYPGGMLDHGLEIIAYALKLRQARLLPVGTTPEDQAAQAEVWTAAVAYAALLHDLGKIAVDIDVEQADGRAWHPWHGPLAQPYRFRYRGEREYRLHSAATGLLYSQVLDRRILDWLSQHQAVWSSLLYVLAGQYEHAGVLGELVVLADQASVAQELGGDPSKALAAPKHALQRKLLEGLRYLLKDEFKLNQPQASDGWLTQDALWLVSKTVSDKLRAHLLSQGIDGIPSSNTTLFNILQDHGMVQATADGKAIWKATVTGENGWSHTFTLLKLAPALIWDDAAQRPPAFAGTVVVEDEVPQDESETTAAAPTAVSQIAAPPTSAVAPAADTVADLMTMISMSNECPEEAPQTMKQDRATPVETAAAPRTDDAATAAPPVTPPTPPLPPSVPPLIPRVQPVDKAPAGLPSGQHFVAWLRQAIQTHKLVINDAKALVHTVADTAYLVSPGVFQRYAQEHPHVAAMAKEADLHDWQWVQKQFEKLQIHRKQPSGLNIWTCAVTGPRKSRKLHGYLLNDSMTLFGEQLLNNPYLELTTTEA
ncbi:TraI domain-containing protein [Burkholderia aenigmatica]|uniref:MobH family relaxase n=1 Tax=Burkholderia aenigmatica TaxID=2015348 RepID=UPI001F18DB47|nr:MobH family relaxase [Burkholderia aenigmatica]UKD17405.1 TraI domain-containing protein [Burkholderia aenigmatica]